MEIVPFVPGMKPTKLFIWVKIMIVVASAFFFFFLGHKG